MTAGVCWPLGLRSPGDQQLFLERYLDQPVEQALGTACGQSVDRQALVEGRNFAVGSAGGGRWLITALTALSHSAARRWAVFTCGPELRNAFRRLGVDLIDLGPAEPDGSRNRTGSLGQLRSGTACDGGKWAQSHAVLSRLFESECALTALWCGALQAGRLAGMTLLSRLRACAATACCLRAALAGQGQWIFQAW